LDAIHAVCSKNGPFLKTAGAAIVVFCKDVPYYLEDGCAATENILIAASALGVGACWIAGDKKPYAAEMGNVLGVPAGYRLISVIALGYPAQDECSAEKRGLQEVLHWERF